ncbi:hypothetical protein GFU95_06735 [Apibacter sp. B3889]|uniref:hypothetical protein n=1 Tax=unclassified Apibacter TaxID=2630820 RepID=UPI001328E84F|nr:MULTISPECIES: hypothetical protein [unclassified Apibacter]MXO34833.1 hypothetical protein [Apibacter sp. B3883]MXO42063.1 hypothetical protein [Apibacter sp. B3889]MXP03633.1 hypothetical protein [Apibacter sp. B3887]MXP08131.1 hypothetical protein [Apibacter sp. B3935]
MMVLNDIEQIRPMHSLNMIKNGIFYISNLYLSENYLELNERLLINDLKNKEELKIFELSNDFYDFFFKNNNENLKIGITDISSIYYAMNNNLPVVTKCKFVKNFAEQNNVHVYDIDKALKIINIDQKYINYLNLMII